MTETSAGSTSRATASATTKASWSNALRLVRLATSLVRFSSSSTTVRLKEKGTNSVGLVVGATVGLAVGAAVQIRGISKSQLLSSRLSRHILSQPLSEILLKYLPLVMIALSPL
jgi:hypothetical protein